MFTDNSRVPGEKPTSIHYRSTALQRTDCVGIAWESGGELDWWRVTTLIPALLRP